MARIVRQSSLGAHETLLRRVARLIQQGLRMLHDFIVENRDHIVERVRRRATLQSATSSPTTTRLDVAPTFLSHLVAALIPAPSAHAQRLVADANQEIVDDAARQGRELQRCGFSVAQVVHGYGDICQVVTDLAGETSTPVSPQDFRVFNECLDNAIAGAVTAHSTQRERALAGDLERTRALSEELGNLLEAATLSFENINESLLARGDATGSAHARNLAALRTHVAHLVDAAHLGSVVMPKLEPFGVSELMAQIAPGAALPPVPPPTESDATPRSERTTIVPGPPPSKSQRDKSGGG